MRDREHLGRGIESDDPAGGSDSLRKLRNAPPGAATGIEHRLAGLHPQRFESAFADAIDAARAMIVTRGEIAVMRDGEMKVRALHQASRARRTPENCQRASAGKKLR